MFVHGDAIAIGGKPCHAGYGQGLSTSLDAAERLKVMHGSALPGSADDRDLVSIQPIGDDGDVPLQIPRSVMTRIVRARIDETLELLRDRLKQVRLRQCGGQARRLDRRRQPACRPAGGGRAASSDANVRIGRPLGVGWPAGAAKGPASRRRWGF